jgi:hypothetical protein
MRSVLCGCLALDEQRTHRGCTGRFLALTEERAEQVNRRAALSYANARYPEHRRSRRGILAILAGLVRSRRGVTKVEPRPIGWLMCTGLASARRLVRIHAATGTRPNLSWSCDDEATQFNAGIASITRLSPTPRRCIH